MMDKLHAVRLPLYILGVFLVFLGQRYYDTSETFAVWLGSGFALITVGILTSLIAAIEAKRSNAAEEAKSLYLGLIWQAVFALGVILSVVFYGLTKDGGGVDTPMLKALLALWLAAMILGGAFGVGVEVAMRTAGRGVYAESSRVARAGLSWLVVGLALVFLIGVNYAGFKMDKATDWSYLKVTSPSEGSQNMVKSLTDELHVGMFFEHQNEVAPFVQEYFSGLARADKNVKIHALDKDLNPTLARELRVSKNGVVVLKKGALDGDGKMRTIRLGENLDRARSQLAKLDQEFQKAFLTINEEKKTVYFTSGHGEHSWVGAANPTKSISLVRKLMRFMNFSVKQLGIKEGLGQDIPEDADLLVIIGASQSFLDGEIEAIKRYLNRGGNVLLAFDVGGMVANDFDAADLIKADPLRDMAAEYGIQFSPEVLANDEKFFRGTKSPVDHWILYTNIFRAHKSVSNLSNFDERIGLLTFSGGTLKLDKTKNPDWNVMETVSSLASSYIDLNKNYRFDSGKEKKKARTIAAIAELKENAKAAMKSKTEGAGEKGDKSDKSDKPQEKKSADKTKTDAIIAKNDDIGGRLLVTADADLFSDQLIANKGNQSFVIEGINWLIGTPEFGGEISNEEDKKISHSNEEHKVWFYGSIIGMPLLILLFGRFATRRRKIRFEN